MTSNLVERHPLKEKRRANKPLLERKRRARINDSLKDLKYLVLSSLNKDVSKFTKMEKVDILDMTVQFLKRQRLDQRGGDYAAVYRAGYSECTNEVIRFVMALDGVDPNAKTKILSHLAQTCQSADRVSPPPSPTPSMVSIHSTGSCSPVPSPTTSPHKAMAAIFNPVRGPVLETSRQVIVPMTSSPRDTNVMYAPASDPDARRLHALTVPIEAKCDLREPCRGPLPHRSSQLAPLASVKPMLRMCSSTDSFVDIYKKESESFSKPDVWRPW